MKLFSVLNPLKGKQKKEEQKAGVCRFRHRACAGPRGAGGGLRQGPQGRAAGARSHRLIPRAPGELRTRLNVCVCVCVAFVLKGLGFTFGFNLTLTPKKSTLRAYLWFPIHTKKGFDSKKDTHTHTQPGRSGSPVLPSGWLVFL